LSNSEFLPGWKKYPGVAETKIKAKFFNLCGPAVSDRLSAQARF
jgi:hypothetical protein